MICELPCNWNNFLKQFPQQFIPKITDLMLKKIVLKFIYKIINIEVFNKTWRKQSFFLNTVLHAAFYCMRLYVRLALLEKSVNLLMAMQIPYKYNVTLLLFLVIRKLYNND